MGPSTAKKLRDGGYVDIESLAVAPVLELMERTGIGFALAQRIIMWAREKIGWDVVSAKELYEKRSKMLRCTTGCRSLDKLLGGGIETQSLTEFIGPYAVGKTQICFPLCVTSQLPVDKGGLDGMVVYLDTEGTFSPERVHQIAEHWSLDPQRVLENIYVRLLSIVNRDDENIHPYFLDIEGWITLFPDFKSIKLIYRPSLLLPIPPMVFGRYLTSRGRLPLMSHLWIVGISGG